ncbi:hypothetical protein BC830DRAFT_1128149 [Chytriomyces sp. MP71]|nr:hypothetical protein BC830DRAFT_1128149 [Chytriomyces sp. MP71]
MESVDRDAVIAHVFDMLCEVHALPSVVSCVDKVLRSAGVGASFEAVANAVVEQLLDPRPPMSTEPRRKERADCDARELPEPNAKKPRRDVPTDSKSSASTSNTHHVNAFDKLKWTTLAESASAPVTRVLTPENVAEFLPCELFLNWLPQETADPLLRFLMKDAAEWKTHHYYIADRLVHGNHRSCIFTSIPHTDFAYTFMGEGSHGRPYERNDHLRETSELVNAFVTKRLVERRVRLHTTVSADPLSRLSNCFDSNPEAKTWDGNICVGNEYLDGKEVTGFHADHLAYIGPRPVIASISLGATRTFRIRRIVAKSSNLDDVESASLDAKDTVWETLENSELDDTGEVFSAPDDTSPQNIERALPSNPDRPQIQHPIARPKNTIYSIKLPHGSLLIMYPPMQELYKHEVPPEKHFPGHPISGLARYNLTFRMYRREFSDPPICRCGVRTDLKPVFKEFGKKQRNEKYYWSCVKGRGEKSGCGYFEWLV